MKALGLALLLSIAATSSTSMPAMAGYRTTIERQVDQLSVTSSNTLSALSRTADGRQAILYVNGQQFGLGDSSPAFSLSGTTVTWSAANAGFALYVGDHVTITYSIR